MSVFLIVGAATALAGAGPQTAPSPDVAGREGATAVDTVVVTAARSPRNASAVGQSVTVLDRAAILDAQDTAVSDLLTRTPGVSVSRNGGIGSATSLRIRGAEADQTVVVIDGVKLNDPSATGGGFNFGGLLIGDLARIEVLRGAQSTLWGGQAVGGVVNLVTAEPLEPFEADLAAETGGRGTSLLRGAAGGAGERVAWRVAGAAFKTRGFSAFARGEEEDGYSNSTVSGRARVTLTDVLSADLRATRFFGRLQFDGFAPPRFVFGDTPEYAKTVELTAYAGLNVDLLDDRFRSRLAYGRTETDRDNINPDQTVTPLTFDARGVNERWEYQGVFAFTDTALATFGAETEESRFRTASPSAFTPNPPVASASVGIDAVYGQLQAQVGPGLTLTVGARRDEHDTFGGRTLGQAAAAWALNDGATVLRASFGQGFKAPTLFQLFSPFGNLDLRPEQADTYDVGVEHRFGERFRAAAIVFARETEQQIDFVSCVSDAPDPLCRVNGTVRSGYYQNLSRTEAQGVELEGAAAFGPLELSANYTWTDAENRSPGANLGRRLPRRPEHQANLEAAWTWRSGLRTAAAARHAGESFDNASNTSRLKGYTLLDLRASYPLTEQVEAYARVENVTDEAYETLRNYGSPGRAAFAGFRARF